MAKGIRDCFHSILTKARVLASMQAINGRAGQYVIVVMFFIAHRYDSVGS